MKILKKIKTKKDAKRQKILKKDDFESKTYDFETKSGKKDKKGQNKAILDKKKIK